MKVLLGLLVRDEETGEHEMISVDSLTDSHTKPKSSGKIVKQPSPHEDRIAREREEDLTLDGRIKKHKEVSKEGV